MRMPLRVSADGPPGGRGADSSLRASRPERRRRPRPGEEDCDLCGTAMPEDHRHLLQLEERRILCVVRELLGAARRRPEYPADRHAGRLARGLRAARRALGAASQIPIGLAFFMRSSAAGGVVAIYPSPAGATESELDLGAWDELVRGATRCSATLEADAEGLIVNRMADPPQYAIAPIDECYALVGLIKASWEGISGGVGVERAIAGFFDELQARAGA